MPSKSQTGSSPLGNTKLGGSSGFVRTEQVMARRTPAYPSNQGWVNLPNGRMYQPKRARGGGAGTGCVPWTPRIVDEHDYEASPDGGPDYKLYLGPGTINGVINSMWNGSIDIVDPVAVDDLNYIVATVTFTDKQVTSIDYTVSGTIPSGNELNPVTLESLPSSIKIILGTLVGTSSCMVWNTNILISGVEVFQETIANPAINTKPYNSWYSYQLNSSA